jgi:hypothetical protein
MARTDALLKAISGFDASIASAQHSKEGCADLV